jgi:hypothetical protein
MIRACALVAMNPIAALDQGARRALRDGVAEQRGGSRCAGPFLWPWIGRVHNAKPTTTIVLDMDGSAAR